MQSTSLESYARISESGKKERQVKKLLALYKKHPKGLADFQISKLLNWPESLVSARRADIPFLCEVVKTIKGPRGVSVQVRVLTDKPNIIRLRRLKLITDYVDKINKGQIKQQYGLSKIRELAAV